MALFFLFVKEVRTQLLDIEEKTHANVKTMDINEVDLFHLYKQNLFAIQDTTFVNTQHTHFLFSFFLFSRSNYYSHFKVIMTCLSTKPNSSYISFAKFPANTFKRISE